MLKRNNTFGGRWKIENWTLAIATPVELVRSKVRDEAPVMYAVMFISEPSTVNVKLSGLPGFFTT